MADPLESLLAAVPMEQREAARNAPELGAALAAACRRATQAYPAIAFDESSFCAFLGARLDGDEALAEQLATRQIEHLYLAWACARGDPAALRHYEAELAPKLDAALRQVTGSADLAAEIGQVVRERLLVGAGEREPRIADYGGRGELLTWLRVIAVRTALSELRKSRRLVPDDDRLWDAASPSAGPEIALLKRESAAEIKEAFQHAMGKLSPRQRNLLRQHLLDGLTIDELGAIYRVHRVTAARWLSKAREELWMQTKRRLRVRLGLKTTQVESLLEEVRSSLDLSIERVLGG